MLAHVFRPTAYLPSPITAICTNNTTIVVFRRSGIVEFLHSASLQRFLSFEIFDEVQQAQFLNMDTVIYLSKTGKISFISISTLQRETIDAEATCIALEFQENTSSVSFTFSTKKNEIFIYKDKKVSQIATVTGTVTCLLSHQEQTLIGTADGWISVISNGAIITEIEIKTFPTSISMISKELFAVSGKNGSLYLINPISEIVMDKLHVRDNPLNVVVSFENRLHTSGADSRIFCAKVAKNKLLKVYQCDPHVSEVLSMCVDNGRILSAGEDCTLVSCKPTLDFYKINIVYDNSIIAGETPEYFFTAFGDSLDLYTIKGGYEDIVEQTNKFNEAITFKIHEDVLSKLTQKRTEYKHFVSIKQQNQIIAADVSYDQKYICISTTKSSFLYSLFVDGSLKIEQLKQFSSSKQVVFTNDYLVLQHLDKTITIFNLNTTECRQIDYKDYKVKIEVTNEYLILPQNGLVYTLQDLTPSVIAPIEEVCCSSRTSTRSKAIFLIKAGDEYKKVVFITPSQIETHDVVQVIDAGAKSSCTMQNISYMHGEEVLSNSNFLFLMQDNKVSSYEIGLLINAVVKLKGNVVVIQSPYKILTKNFKKSVFKEKFSNK
ncbi:hypothetical protein GINT2_001339 [Glugoides intestinalis]